MKRRELELTSDERTWLEHFTRTGSVNHQAFKRAQILLAAAEPSRMGDAELAQAIGVSKATVYNTRSRYLTLGVQETVRRRARKDKGIPEKVDGRVEAHIIALACSATPNEEPAWTLKMLADKLVDTLRARKELTSTYIVFTSDHGLHYGEHRLLRTKLTPYDASKRIPLVVRDPGIPVGRTVNALTLLSDVAPTLTDLAAVPAPDFVDGRSLAPWLRRNASRVKERQQVLLEFWPREGFPVDEREEPEHMQVKVPEYRALRSRRYLYTEYRYPDGSREPELYDLVRDPFELRNYASTADAALLRSLSAKLEELQDCRAAACRLAEDGGLRGE